jgi:hypothetical protein
MTPDEQRQRYYGSREWSVLKRAVHERSGGRCERCRANAGAAVHHITYARLYHEDLDDLWHLCRGCHAFIHAHSDIDPEEVAQAEVGEWCRLFEIVFDGGNSWRRETELEWEQWCASCEALVEIETKLIDAGVDASIVYKFVDGLEWARYRDNRKNAAKQNEGNER